MSELQLDRREFASLLKASGNNLRKIRIEEHHDEHAIPQQVTRSRVAPVLVLWHAFALFAATWIGLTFW